MNRFISGLRRLQLRQTLLTFMAGLLLFVSATLGFGYGLQADAARLTPEAEDYPVQQREARREENAKLAREKAEEAKEATDSPQDKLNLDEPIPASTKKFFKQIQGEDVEVKEEMPPTRRHNTEN